MTQVIQQHISRRKAIVAGTTAVVGATGLALGTREAGAQASVEMGELAIEPAEFAPDDAEVYSPWLLLTGSWEYQIQADPAVWETYMLVYGPDGNSEAIAIDDGETTARQATGTYAMRGPISAASFYSAETFSVPDGESSVTVTVPVEVAFLVRDDAGDMLIQERVTDDAVITVTSEGVTMANLSGAGQIVAQDDSSDPTPDAPEA